MRLRFSLRLLLCLFTLVALLLGSAANFAYSIKAQVRRHKSAVAKLQAMGCRIHEADFLSFNEETSPFVAFARKWIDEDYAVSAGDFQCERRLSPSETKAVLQLLRGVHGVDEIKVCVSHLSNECFDLLAAHRGLENLDLDYLSLEKGVSGRWKELEALRVLDIEQPIDDEAAIAISQLPKLCFLYADISEISMHGAESITRRPTLELLSLHGEISKADVLNEVFKSKSIGSLSLSKAKVGDSAIAAFENAAKIEQLSLFDCNLPSRVCAAIAKMPVLRSLSLQFEKGAPALDYHSIQNCQKLEEIHFWFTELSEAEFGSIKPNQGLLKLHCEGDISDQVILTFLQAAPQCEIDLQAPRDQRVSYTGRRFTLKNSQLQCEEYTLEVCGFAMEQSSRVQSSE